MNATLKCNKAYSLPNPAHVITCRAFRVAKLGGHTAGVGGHAAKLIEMGMAQQQDEQVFIVHG